MKTISCKSCKGSGEVRIVAAISKEPYLAQCRVCGGMGRLQAHGSKKAGNGVKKRRVSIDKAVKLAEKAGVIE